MGNAYIIIWFSSILIGFGLLEREEKDRTSDCFEA
jgi:hypothetical protein